MTQNFMGFNPIVPKVAAGVQQLYELVSDVNYKVARIFESLN